MLGVVAVFALAQDPPTPAPASTPNPPVAKPAPKVAPPAGSVYYAEQFRRLRGGIEELKGAHTLQQEQSDKLKKKIKLLTDENLKLNRRLAGNFATTDEVKALQIALKEMDANRLKDRSIFQKALGDLGKLIQKVAQQKSAAPSVDPTPRTATQDFKFNTHKVQTGEFLGTIIIAYNRAYKEEGLGIVTQSQVLKANPGLNPNRLLIGQKIKIPLPGEIK